MPAWNDPPKSGSVGTIKNMTKVARKVNVLMALEARIGDFARVIRYLQVDLQVMDHGS